MKKLNYYFVGINHENHNKINIATYEECINYIKELNTVAVDIETTKKYGGLKSKYEGLDPYTSEIVMIQVGDRNKQFVIDAREIDCKELIRIISKKLVVGHNLVFEYKFFLVHFNIRLEKLYDTMIAELILYNGLGYKNSLEALNKRYLDIEVDKSTRNEFLTIGSKPFTLRQIEYGAEDILYPLEIRGNQIPKIKKDNLKNCIELEMSFTMVLGDIMVKGMNFNKEVWLEAANEAKIKYDEYIEKLSNFAMDNYPQFIEKQLSFFHNERKCIINWSSTKQVIELFDVLDICPEAVSKSTGKLRKTLAKNELESKITDDDLSDKGRWLIKNYLEMKKTERAVNTFGKTFFKYINPITERIHTSYRQIMNTGRISSTRPNLQNIPSSNIYRMAFDAPEGFKIVNADYAGQEQVVLVNKCLDKDLLNFYRNGHTDMHSFIASKVFGVSMKDIVESKTKKDNRESLTGTDKENLRKRSVAKAAGFAINYGGTGYTIAKNLGISESEGDYVYNQYFKAFPGLLDYFNTCLEKAMDKGYILIDKITSRKYYYNNYNAMTEASSNGDTHTYNKLKSKLFKRSLNYPIQGESGSITKYAAILFRKHLLENDLYDRYQMTNLIHDEINCEAKEEYAEECAELLEKCMVEAGQIWCKTIPLKADAVISDYWTH